MPGHHQALAQALHGLMVVASHHVMELPDSLVGE
jgi:hypothetical protein